MVVKIVPQQKGEFHLCIDEMLILKWFKMKFQELKEKLGVSRTRKEEDTPDSKACRRNKATHHSGMDCFDR